MTRQRSTRRAMGCCALAAMLGCSSEGSSGAGESSIGDGVFPGDTSLGDSGDSGDSGDDTGGSSDSGDDGQGQGLLVEILVSPDDVVDFEFDWGRDGVHCTDCNDGDGNSRFAFTDRQQNLWLGYVDPETGDFDPPDGRALLLDRDAAFATDFGNGPEWMSSTGSSEIVYTKYDPDLPQSTLSAGAAIASPGAAGEWTVGILPAGLRSQSPAATLDLDDPNPRINFQDFQKVFLYWVDVTDPQAPGATQHIPIAEITSGGSRRWVPETRDIVFSGGAPPDENGEVYQQVFRYGTDSGVLEQLTFEPENKFTAFMWRAPEYDNEYVFFTVAAATKIKIYRELPNSEGVPTWTETNSIDSPAALPYIWSPEPFVYNGKSYVFMQLSSSPDASDMRIPTQIAITGIEPELPSFKMLSNDSSIRRVRQDPEHFITKQGAFIYYNRYIPATAESQVVNDGVWRVDSRLGPPIE